MPDYGPRVATLGMPVHLVVGAEDAKFRALAEAMLPRLRQGRLTVLPACGHNAPLEAPAAVAAALEPV
jgi:2-succinyl-6-hydroxy-2,4-cyclohexadiene-1-carboxylate synthase